MRRFLLSAHVLFCAAYLPACGGGSEEPAAPVDAAAPFQGDVPSAMAPSVPDVQVPADVTPSVSDDPEGSPNVQQPGDLGEVEEMPPTGMPQVPVAGNGLLINGACTALCLSDATDADATTGATDGWGWENEASCLVAGSAPASQGIACDLMTSEPLPPPALPGSNVIRPEGVDSTGFYVAGGRLFDRYGNDFVMRGINDPLAWFQNRNTGALQWLDEIASTGANSVRLVWETDVMDTTLLRQAIQRSIDLNMVPMVELHDVTGGRDVDDPARMARYYAETDAVREILLDYEDYLLINIANEWDGPNDIYVDAYTRAITVLRDAGLNHTLVLDANGYGQSANTVITQGQTLLGIDPQHNLLFSTHMYESFRNAQTIRDTLQRAADAQVPFIVGEFGFQHGTDNQGNPIQIPFDVLLEQSEQRGFGYLAWSWTGNSADVAYLDLTAQSGSADALSDWGNDIVNGPNGIRATAVPASLFTQP